MRFTALIALVASVSAIKLQHKPKSAQFVSLHLKWDQCPTPAQEKEVHDWVKAELKKDGSINKDEAEAGLKAFAEKHGLEVNDEVLAVAEEVFDYVDTNDDGKLSGKELGKAWDAHEAEYRERCPAE